MRPLRPHVRSPQENSRSDLVVGSLTSVLAFSLGSISTAATIAGSLDGWHDMFKLLQGNADSANARVDLADDDADLRRVVQRDRGANSRYIPQVSGLRKCIAVPSDEDSRQLGSGDSQSRIDPVDSA